MLTTLLTACVWGLGLSCGMAGGFVVWVMVVAAMPQNKKMKQAMELHEKSLDALLVRNTLTVETNETMACVVGLVSSVDGGLQNISNALQDIGDSVRPKS